MNKKSIIAIWFVIQTSLLTPAFCLAWGANGHKLIVETALSLLSPQAKEKVMAALGGYSPDFAAVWMDSVRHRVPQYKYMDGWHFVNMEAGQNYVQVANENDVVFNLQRMITFFNHIPPGVSKDSIQMNLKILFHLMGDITQPLHVGYGSDKGGNDDPVTSPKFEYGHDNLHHFWDDIVIQEGKSQGVITQPALLAYCKGMTASQLQNINQGDTKAWLIQSRNYLPSVYSCHPVKNVNTNLTLGYLDNDVPIVRQQLCYGAVRLAAVLEKAFGG